jgi:hypothetical protein
VFTINSGGPLAAALRDDPELTVLLARYEAAAGG